MNVLIVTGNENTLKEFDRQLPIRGQYVEFAATGRQAYELMSSQKFDCVITDVFLPDMSGIEFIKFLKTCRAGIKIIAMSEYNSREIEMEVRKQGVVYYMLTPSDLKNLDSIIFHMEKKCPEHQLYFNREEPYHNNLTGGGKP